MKARASLSRATLAYFGIVFACGFALGTARVLWLVPRLGERNAELAETPLMLLATLLAARFVVVRWRVRDRVRRAAVGAGALALLVLAELGVVLFVRHESLADYVASRDPVAGTVYLVALGLFGAAPLLVGPRERSTRQRG